MRNPLQLPSGDLQNHHCVSQACSGRAGVEIQEKIFGTSHLTTMDSAVRSVPVASAIMTASSGMSCVNIPLALTGY